MDYIIRFLVISFPFIFMAAIFWPAIEPRFLSSPSPIGEDHPLNGSSPIIEKFRSKIPEIVVNPTHAQSIVAFPQSNISRRTDDRVRVLFAEHPGQKNTEPFTPWEMVHPVREAEISEYRFSHTSADQRNGYVFLTGSLSGDTACRNLQVVAYAKSDSGFSARGVDEISFNGQGSASFEMEVESYWDGKGPRPRWSMTSVSASCSYGE